MYPMQSNLHGLQTDAGEDMREVIGHYPILIESVTPGYYYQLVSLDILPCAFPDRWRTLSQWQPVREEFVDGLGTN